MKNKKLWQSCMAGILSAAVLLTGVPAAAADFTDSAVQTEAMAEEAIPQSEEPAAENTQSEEPAAEAQSDDIEVFQLPQTEETPQSEAAAQAVESDGEEDLFQTEEEDMFSEDSAEATGDVKITSTVFPDSKFRAYVKTFDKNVDGTLQASEISAVDEIDVTAKGIAKLNGIEKFTALKTLKAANNSLTSVNLTKNTKLGYVNLNNNKLTTLDLSKCTGYQSKDEWGDTHRGIRTIVCANNKLTTLKLADVKYLANLEYINISNNKFTSQKNAGLANISNSTLVSLTEIDAGNNQITSFNCSGFEGILRLPNNKLTTFTGGTEGFQAAWIDISGSGNTLSKTTSVNFASLGNRVPSKFSYNSSAKSKFIMVAPTISAKSGASFDKIVVTMKSSAADAKYTLQKKTGTGAYSTVKTFTSDDMEDDYSGMEWTDTAVKPNQSYTYYLKASVETRDANNKVTTWTSSKAVTVKTLPGTPSFSSVKSSAKKTAAVTWKTASNATGYQLYYGTSKTSMKKLASTSKTTYTYKKFISGKTIYFKVRAYKTINGKTYYGSFSPIKSVKIK